MILLGWKLGKWGMLSMGITAVEANRGGLLVGGTKKGGCRPETILCLGFCQTLALNPGKGSNHLSLLSATLACPSAPRTQNLVGSISVITIRAQLDHRAELNTPTDQP